LNDFVGLLAGERWAVERIKSVKRLPGDNVTSCNTSSDLLIPTTNSPHIGDIFNQLGWQFEIFEIL
jgi:hypothetical protein